MHIATKNAIFVDILKQLIRLKIKIKCTSTCKVESCIYTWEPAEPIPITSVQAISAGAGIKVNKVQPAVGVVAPHVRREDVVVTLGIVVTLVPALLLRLSS